MRFSRQTRPEQHATGTAGVTTIAGAATDSIAGDASTARLLASVHDLGATLEARETQLRDAETFRQMVNATPRSLAFVSAEAGWRITLLNAAAERDITRHSGVFGVPANRIVGAGVNEMFDIQDLTTDLLRTQTSAIFRTVRQGQLTFELYVAPAIDAHGAHVGALLVWTDTTEKHKTLDNVAQSFDGLSGAIRDIAVSAQEAITTIQEAELVGQDITDRFARLRESSDAVGAVVGVIERVASQTQLLALNATIEAARVGEAGRGFAVVANEVKTLAQETAQSTGDIRGQIGGIQHGTTSASSAVTRIVEILSEIEARQVTIAAAVEEQTITTVELRRALEQTLGG